MTWNKVHHISLHKPISFDMLSLVAWLDSLTTKHRHKGQTELQLWIPLRFYPCSSRTECIMVATLHLWLIDLPMLHLLLCLFSLKGAHPFDEHFLCAAEKIAISLFLLSLPPPHSLITPSLSPIAPSPSYSHYRYRRCCSRISSQYGCWTWRGMIPTGWQKVKMEGGKKGWGQR